MTQSLPPAETSIEQSSIVSEYSTLTWTTIDGRVCTLATMRTDHLFFAMRMLYDLAATREGWERMRPPGVGRRANPHMGEEHTALYLAAFATDIIARGDLAEEHQPQFKAMMDRLLRRRYAIKPRMLSLSSAASATSATQEEAHQW